MTLQEFTRESLLQISAGVGEAYRKNVNVGFEVSALGKQEASCTAEDGRAGFLVDFDVAVTVTDKTGKEGGGSISVANVIGFGGKASTASETSSVSRVKFCVPIIYSVD